MSNIPLEFEGGRKLEIEVFQLATMKARRKKWGGENDSILRPMTLLFL